MNYPIDLIKDTSQPVKDNALAALQKVRPLVCGVYKNNPFFFIPSEALPFPSGVTDAITNQLDNFCSDQPLPPPREQPYLGGQCECVVYRVDTTSKSSATATPTTVTGNLFGPVLPLRYVVETTSPLSYVAYRDSVTCQNGKVTGIITQRQGGFTPGGGVTLGNIRRLDGLPDTCGNPDRTEPGLPTAQPPSINFNVELPDIRANANIIVPVFIFRPVVNVNLALNPNFNVSIPIRIGNNNYELNNNTVVRVEPPNRGINFTEINNSISASNTSLTNSISNSITAVNNNTNSKVTALQTAVNSNTNTSITNSVATIKTNTDLAVSNSQTSIVNALSSKVDNAVALINAFTNTSLVSVDSDLATTISGIALVRADVVANANIVLDVKATLERCPCPLPVSSPDVSPENRPAEEKASNNPKTQAVTIVVTRLPNKLLWGGGNNAPDKLIAGWFAWKVKGGGWLTQQPINYSESTFIRPPQAEGYSYTLTNSAEGFAIQHNLP